MRRAQIFLFIFFLMVAGASAIKPSIQSSEAGTIQVTYPKLEYFKIDSSENLHFHIFNSTGHILKNDTTSCEIHIYNKSDEHIAQALLKMSSNNKDFEYVWNISGLTKGTYPYTVFCNNSVQAGFLSDSFELNYDGEDPKEPSVPIAIIILLPMILAFLLIHGASTMGDEHVVMKIATYLLSPVFFMVSFHMSMLSIIRFYNWQAMEELIGSSTYWIGIGVMGLLITYFLIYLFTKITHQAAQEKEERLRY